MIRDLSVDMTNLAIAPLYSITCIDISTSGSLVVGYLYVLCDEQHETSDHRLFNDHDQCHYYPEGVREY